MYILSSFYYLIIIKIFNTKPVVWWTGGEIGFKCTLVSLREIFSYPIAKLEAQSNVKRKVYGLKL